MQIKKMTLTKRLIGLIAAIACFAPLPNAALAQDNSADIAPGVMSPDEVEHLRRRNGQNFSTVAGSAHAALYPGSDEYVGSDVYRVEIDCSTEGISNDGTGNNISIIFYDREANIIKGWARNDMSDQTCVWSNPDFEFSMDTEPYFISASTDGTDAFMIDRLMVYGHKGKIAEFGKNDDLGWCLSEDYEDGTRSWAHAANGQCAIFYVWSLRDATVAEFRRNLETSGALGNFTGTADGQANRNYRYELDIDCDVDDIENEGTGNTLTAIYFNANRHEIGRSSFKKDTNGAVLPICRDMEWETIVRGTARYLQIHTDGTDGAMLDQIFVERDGEEIEVFGTSNASGWCLSNQVSDAHGSWSGHAYQNECRSYWEFEF